MFCFLFWGRIRNPGLKKKGEEYVEHVTYVTVDSNSLLELKKIYCFKSKYCHSLWSQVCSVAIVTERIDQEQLMKSSNVRSCRFISEIRFVFLNDGNKKKTPVVRP